MPTDYFHRVTRETPTRFWINNPSADEMEQALDAGAIACTTNPTYGAKLLRSEPEYLQNLIDQALITTPDDDTAADLIVQQATARLLARFLPLYESSSGTQGFVTLQSDPRQDEDADALIQAALRYRSLGPNFMAKIPVTAAGLTAMEYLIAEDIPLCATEVFSLDQTLALCDLYRSASEKTGKHPPCYVTHITGIFDEYLSEYVEREEIPISSETLAWAGYAVARKEYRLIREWDYPVTLLGGGARSSRHFTDFVGGEVHITINWNTAHELLEANPPVVAHINTDPPPKALQELSQKLPDFRRAYNVGALSLPEFADYGPVQLFRNRFIAGYERLLTEVASRRALHKEAVPAATGSA